MNFKTWLRETASEEDYNEELAYAQRLIQQEVRIEGFGYYEDYVKTVAKEAGLIKGKCIFVGSGPVPLTPILLKKNHGIDVDALEYNAQAVDISKRVLEVLQVPIRVMLGDAITFKGFGGYGTIMLALEAGPTEGTKTAIFENIRSQASPRTIIIIRGSNLEDTGEGFPHVEGYVDRYFKVLAKIPVFSNLSTTYILHCEMCPAEKAQTYAQVV